MSAQHTPGPWEVQNSDQWRAESRDTGFATFCHVGPPKGLAVALAVSDEDGEGHEVEANARLIAAAPDLLDAIEALLGWVKAWDCDFVMDDEWPADDEKIKAAIAKARGEAA